MEAYLDHVVSFKATEAGEDSLRRFIKSVPEAWNADFYELYRAETTSRVILQFFRTKQRLNRFEATPLARDSGAVDWSWNSDHVDA